MIFRAPIIQRCVHQSQGLMQAIFDIGIPILTTLIWACPHLILIENKTEPVNVVPAF